MVRLQDQLPLDTFGHELVDQQVFSCAILCAGGGSINYDLPPYAASFLPDLTATALLDSFLRDPRAWFTLAG